MNRDTDGISIALSGVTVAQRGYDPDTDAYLIRGTAGGRHVVGWQPRHARPRALTACAFFAGEAEARRQFDALAAGTERPDVPGLQKDWQKAAVYAWEEDCLMRHGSALDERQARTLIRRVSRDYHIQAPKLVWGKFTNRSEYDEEENTIYFGARDNITLLHELAHAVHAARLEGEETGHHAPGFVWCAAELYNRYAGIGMNLLIASAAQAGVLGDIGTAQLSQAAERRRIGGGKKPPGFERS